MKYIELNQESIPIIQDVFSDIVQIWCHWHANEAKDYTSTLTHWEKMIATGEFQGLIGIKDGQAQSIIWKEQPQPTYATVVVHTIGNQEDLRLVQTFIQKNYVDNLVFELIQYTEGFAYRDTFIDHGYFEKERQRMLFEIPDDFSKSKEEDEILYEPITDQYEDIARISCSAHFSRKFIEGYAEFAFENKRQDMSQKLRENPDSNYLHQSSVLMKLDNKVVGICEVVTWKIWGDEPVAWIMDIAIDPEYHGLGYGYRLLEHVVYETKTKHNMDKIGLSVTISNVNAKSLYDRFGFKDYEFYVEMIDPMAIKNYQ